MPSLKAAQPMEKRALKTRSRTGASPIVKLAGLFKGCRCWQRYFLGLDSRGW